MVFSIIMFVAYFAVKGMYDKMKKQEAELEFWRACKKVKEEETKYAGFHV